MDAQHSFKDFVLPSVDFGRAEFAGAADFERVQHEGDAVFYGAKFRGNAYFLGARFGGRADFRISHFEKDAHFSVARFAREANLSEARFLGQVYFTRAEVEADLVLFRSVLHNRMLFEGTRIGGRARVLLWGLDFVHGTSEIRMDSETRNGRVTEPAGQVVFRDIAGGMSRVSFLHTEVYSDRPYVTFSNVKWTTHLRSFLYDANFVSRPVSEWQALGPATATNWLRALFNQWGQRSDEALRLLVHQDVQRVVREIRRSTEAYGSYSEAGDYYAVEMDYRRIQTRWQHNFFTRAALETYRLVSKYGESPVRALGFLAGIICGFALLYLFTGFRFQGVDIRRILAIDLSHTWETLKDYGLSLLFALANIVPGYFRLQTERLTSTSEVTTVLSFLEALLGVTTLTLFLLAVRRRFSR
jgi:hypothetical protein